MSATDVGLSFAADAVPYSYIGDSHAGPVGKLVFDDPNSPSKIVTQSMGIWRFVAADMMGDDGMVSEAVTQVFRRLGVFHSQTSYAPLSGLRPVLTRYGSQMQVEQLALTSFANDAPYVFTVGEINIRYILYRLVTDEIDFEVPFPIDELEELPAPTARTVWTAQQMLNVLVEDFKPLFRGLGILRKAGMRTLFLHCVVPPTVAEDDSERVLQHASSAIVRYKLTMFVNFLYEAVCRELDIGFVNTWPLVTNGGVLDPKYYLDGLHLNKEHSILSVNEVHRQLTIRKAAADRQEPVAAP